MRYQIVVVMVVLLALISSCSQGNSMKASSPNGSEKVATHYIDLLREHQYAQIEHDMDPALQNLGMHRTLVKMSGIIPAQPPLSVKIVGASTFESSSLRKTNLDFEYQYPDRWLLIDVVAQTKGDVSTIIGFHVQKLPDSLENSSRFGLSGKSPLQYAVLGAVIAVPLLCIYALVLCANTPIPERKWLWIIFILAGICKFSINWATGQWGFMPMAVQLLGVAFFQPLYGPWVLSVSLPLGAILFLLKRKSFIAAASIQPASPPPLPGNHGENH